MRNTPPNGLNLRINIPETTLGPCTAPIFNIDTIVINTKMASTLHTLRKGQASKSQHANRKQ